MATDTPRKDGPRTLSTEEWARLRAVDDIARELVDGWDNGFPTTGGQSETDLVDRLRPFLTDPVEPAEAAAGPRDEGSAVLRDCICPDSTLGVAVGCPVHDPKTVSWRDASRRLHVTGDDEPYASDDVAGSGERHSDRLHRAGYRADCPACQANDAAILATQAPREETPEA